MTFKLTSLPSQKVATTTHFFKGLKGELSALFVAAAVIFQMLLSEPSLLFVVAGLLDTI